MLTLIDFEPAHFQLLGDWFACEQEVVRWGGPALRHPLDHRQLQAIVDERLATPPTRLSWMADDGALVGHIELALERERLCARIARVVIAPEHRGRGLGRRLVARAVDVAWHLHWTQQVDLRVYRCNEPALATCRGLGFVTTRVELEERKVAGERWEVETMVLDREASRIL